MSNFIKHLDNGKWTFTPRIRNNETPNEWREIFRLKDAETMPSDQYHKWVIQWKAIYKIITEDIRELNKYRKTNAQHWTDIGLPYSKYDGRFNPVYSFHYFIQYYIQSYKLRLRGIARAMLEMRVSIKQARKEERAKQPKIAA